MHSEWRHLIERIHATSPPAVIVVTGGGASAIADLLSVPGGSRTILEAVVPYSEDALVDWLGKAPDHFCVEETALAMAAVAFQRAGELAARAAERNARHEPDGRRAKDEEGGPAIEVPSSFILHPSSFSPSSAIGVACTASLVSDRPKKGEHRCHVATQTGSSTASFSLVLEKGIRDRAAEEQLVGRLLMLALARAAGLDELPALDLRPSESVIEHLAQADPLLVDLLEGRHAVVWSEPLVEGEGRGTMGEERGKNEEERREKSEERKTDVASPISPPPSPFALRPYLLAVRPRGLLCGSFHPLHFGHRQLREVAERILGGPVYYEMSIRNVDKPPLDFLSIDRRRAQFTDIPLALTAAPTFAQKAAALTGVVFVVGADTAERIVQAKYYGGSADATRAALEHIRRAGCRFLVAGRQVGNRFETLSDIPIPTEFANLFSGIAAADFRADVSSTQLRQSRTV
jgi:hypothetical protein